MNTLGIFRSPYSGFVEGFIADASRNLKDVKINNDVIVRTSKGIPVRRYELRVDVDGFSHFIRVHDVGENAEVSLSLFVILYLRS